MQYVEKKFIKIDYNIFVQNHVYYNMLSKKVTLWGGGARVKDLTPQCGGEEFQVPTLAT
jgi:hypothetical protein